MDSSMIIPERSMHLKKFVDLSFLMDNGGRRLGLERRMFSYTEHIPERRLGDERRSGFDRRLGQRAKP